jgi:predicted SAM-dependent methyltransferase
MSKKTKASSGLWLEYAFGHHDLRKPLPWKEGAACAVYASHLLENLSAVQAMRLLQECFRVLEGGGVIRLMVPDLENLARQYVAALDEDTGTNDFPIWQTPADRFLSQTLLRSRTAPSGTLIYQLYKLAMEFDSHKWMYDKVSLTNLVRAAGFAEVEIAERQVSRIPNIHETNKGLIVEGVKRSRGSDK